MNNTFFSGRDIDITFTARLKTFIKESSQGYYIDILIPDSSVVKLMREGIVPKYVEDGLYSGFVLRCRVYSSSIISCNGRRLKYLTKEITSQSQITPDNTKIKTLELHPYSNKPRNRNDAQCSLIRATFKTSAQKLPNEF